MGLQLRALMLPTDIDPNPNSQTDMDPDQISFNWCCSRANNPLRYCSYMSRRLNQSQKTWSPVEYIQQTSGIHLSLSGPDQLSRHTSRLLLNLPTDNVAAPFIFCQLTLVTPSNVSNLRQDFQNRSCGSSRAVWNTGSRRSSFLWHALWKLFSIVSLKDCLSIFSRPFIFMWYVHPINVKITITKFSYPFPDRTPINPYD